MKKLLTAVSILAFATSAFAGFQGGNAQSSSNTHTVASAKKSADDSYVTLRGYIVESLGNEKYTFKDKTGTIRVEIDDEVWGGLDVTPNTLVTIYGEVDRDFGSVEIDVKRISQ